MKSVAIVGTGTEIGKTWIAARLATELAGRQKIVAARKPAQSFDVDDAVELLDASILAAATGQQAIDVCPPHRWYPLAMAPPMAAAALGNEPILASALLDEMCWPAGVDIGLIETAGGLRSPLADDADNLQFVALASPDAVVLVADAGLGTINLVRLCADLLKPWPFTVILNRFDSQDSLHRRNARWLIERDCLPVVTAVAELAERVLGHCSNN